LTSPALLAPTADLDQEAPTREIFPAPGITPSSGSSGYDIRTSPDHAILKVIQDEIQLNRAAKKGSEG
jgi:hypothetical protein